MPFGAPSCLNRSISDADVRMHSIYTQAIEHQPHLDVALANLANAIKDMVCPLTPTKQPRELNNLQGRPWDAIVYYRRAVAVNPSLPEATCGLVNSLNAICDWRGRGKVPSETVAIDEDGNIYEHTENEEDSFPGWMSKLIDTCEGQLVTAYSHNIGIVSATRPLQEWLELVEMATGNSLSTDDRSRWSSRFGPFYGTFDRLERRVNEGGFVIRFIEWAQRRLQRRCYLEVYGMVRQSEMRLSPPSTDTISSFVRPALPPSMGAPLVPSVLPFHTVSYFSHHYN